MSHNLPDFSAGTSSEKEALLAAISDTIHYRQPPCNIIANPATTPRLATQATRAAKKAPRWEEARDLNEWLTGSRAEVERVLIGGRVIRTEKKAREGFRYKNVPQEYDDVSDWRQPPELPSNVQTRFKALDQTIFTLRQAFIESNLPSGIRHLRQHGLLDPRVQYSDPCVDITGITGLVDYLDLQQGQGIVVEPFLLNCLVMPRGDASKNSSSVVSTTPGEGGVQNSQKTCENVMNTNQGSGQHQQGGSDKRESEKYGASAPLLGENQTIYKGKGKTISGDEHADVYIVADVYINIPLDHRQVIRLYADRQSECSNRDLLRSRMFQTEVQPTGWMLPNQAEILAAEEVAGKLLGQAYNEEAWEAGRIEMELFLAAMYGLAGQVWQDTELPDNSNIEQDLLRNLSQGSDEGCPDISGINHKEAGCTACIHDIGNGSQQQQSIDSQSRAYTDSADSFREVQLQQQQQQHNQPGKPSLNEVAHVETSQQQRMYGGQSARHADVCTTIEQLLSINRRICNSSVQKDGQKELKQYMIKSDIESSLRQFGALARPINSTIYSNNGQQQARCITSKTTPLRTSPSVARAFSDDKSAQHLPSLRVATRVARRQQRAHLRSVLRPCSPTTTSINPLLPQQSEPLGGAKASYPNWTKTRATKWWQSTPLDGGQLFVSGKRVGRAWEKGNVLTVCATFCFTWDWQKSQVGQVEVEWGEVFGCWDASKSDAVEMFMENVLGS